MYKRTMLRKSVSILLIIAFVITQMFVMGIGSLAVAPTELSCTVSPVAGKLSGGTLASSTRITVIESSGTKFTANNATPYLMIGSNTYGTLTNITTSATTVAFTVASGLASGTYTIRIVDPLGTYNVGTFTAGDPTLTSTSPASIAKGYSQNIPVTLYGSNTNFSSGKTTVTILDGSTVMDYVGGVNSVTNAGQLEFSLTPGLPTKTYKIKATSTLPSGSEEVAEGTGLLTVRGVASIALSQSTFNYGYSQTSITVTGDETGFDSTTTVQVLYDIDGDQQVDSGVDVATGKATGKQDGNAESLVFTLSEGLAAGNYLVKVQTGEDESAITRLTVGSPSAVVSYQGSTWSGTAQGYSSTYALTLSGTNTSFSNDTDIYLYNLDPSDDDYNENTNNLTDDYISQATYSSPTAMTFTLGKDLPAQTYYVRGVTGNQTVQTNFTITPVSIASITYNTNVVESGTNIIPAGYEEFQINITGDDTSFNQNTTTVQIYQGATLQESKTGDKSVNQDTQVLSFNLKEGLTAGSYTIKIDMDGNSSTTADILEQAFTVTSASISSVSPNTAIIGNTPVTVTVIGQNTRFTSGTPSIDFTGVDGETVQFVSAAEYNDDQDKEQLVFTFIPADALFNPGVYSFTISMSNSYIVSSVTGSVTLTSGGITVSPSTVYSNELGSRSMTITGTNTAFDTATGKTKVYIDSTSSTAITANVVTATSITFTVPSSLSAGSHTIYVLEDYTDEAANEYTTSFLVTERSVTLSPTYKEQGYSQFTMSVTATGFTFDESNKPTVTAGGTDVGTVTILSGQVITFLFPTGKTAGSLTVSLNMAGSLDDVTLNKTFYISPSAPTASPAGGTYNVSKTVTITPGNGASATYYTVDTSEPTSSSTPYSTPITINGTDGQTITLKAVSYDAQSSKGAVMTQSYVFDKAAPTNQDTVFPASVYSIGGQAVTIVSSGTGSNQVWFAPAGTTVFSEELTMTKAVSGTSTSILAHATAGSYKLYVLDSVGNISNPSAATLTVDNTAPTASIAYDDSTIEGGQQVNITATFSEAMLTGTAVKITVTGANQAITAQNMTRVDATHYTYSYVAPSGTGPATVTLSNGTNLAGIVITEEPTGGATFTISPGSNPTAAITYSDSDTIVKQGNNLIITATFDKDMSSDPKVKIAISGSQSVAATDMTRISERVWRYVHVVGSGDGTATITLSNGADLNSNVLVGTPTSGGTFTVDNTAPSTPVANPAAGSYTSARTVTLTSTGSSSIYYTTDESTPDELSNLYSEPITVPVPSVLKVIAYDEVDHASSVLTANYLKKSADPAPTTAPSAPGGAPINNSPPEATNNTEKPSEPTNKATENVEPKNEENNTTNPPIDLEIKKEEPQKEVSITEQVETKIDLVTETEIVEIGEEKLQSVIETAKETLKEGEKLELVLTLPQTGIDKKEFILDEKDLGVITENKADIKVKSNESEVVLPTELLKELKDSTVKVNIKPINATTTPEFRKIIPNKSETGLSVAGSIIEFTISSVKDSKVTEIKEFKSEVKISITPDNLNSKKVDTRKLAIYYLDEKANKWNYVGGRFNPDTGKVETNVGHLTKFALMEYKKNFKDIEGNWAKDFIDVLVSKHVITGFDESTFAPKATTTRAQFATMLVKALNIKVEPYLGKFADAKQNEWFTPFVETAAKAGIVNGTDVNKFSPDLNVTREQMTAMIIRAFTFKTGKSAQAIIDKYKAKKFEDAGDIKQWAVESVKAATILGIINGMSPTRFAPKENSMREQTAKVIYKLLDLLKEL